MAATMTTRILRPLATFAACTTFALVLVGAYRYGMERCEATKASNPPATDTRVNGAC